MRVNCLCSTIERSIWKDDDATTLDLINVIAKSGTWCMCCSFWTWKLKCIEQGKARCLQKLVQMHPGNSLNYHLLKTIAPRLWVESKDRTECISVLLAAGAKLPKEQDVRKDCHLRELRNAALVLLKDVRIGFNRAQKAALTLLMIKRFHPLEGVLQCVNMDVMRLIARMVYASGAFDWKTWRNKRAVGAARKRRKVLGKRK